MGSKEVGKMIRQKRKALNWTQEHLAARARMKAQYLSRIERGKQQPSLNILEEIAKALGSELIIDIPLEQKTKQQQAIDKLVSLLKDKSPDEIQVLTTMIEVLESYGKKPID